MFQVLSKYSAAPLRSLQSCQASSDLHQPPASWLGSPSHSACPRAGNPTVDTGMNQCLGETLHQFQGLNKLNGQEVAASRKDKCFSVL